ncbi:MAG: 1-acyl-sn-glycerol-3-phosphate acyltransferase [Phenylobacterium sp.]|jgi:putative hemolysin|uniref:GNAT family N-acetyltransferase n=1 Tax=Phenylobacterium sp. TaxID=1871053 RepID=UPI0025DA9E9F|nr:1-acyl-sn-glycerol-3-phosphate acyltransferase [Phenylobacterium sp.]MCA3731566.1 1-acyl-sn-glycerol-3-phosphate acyltransferase [Phenylobacterium sp.]MCA3736538.1 1-acyl-sn-glycerol-3-phosphate acyltransferase [Phenylobacterium sp.]MCA4916503.1 1-acyl-sn-glycerol-3-phosphate acyltransferase [Phenylobacterium sp.]MCA6244108.1 1-acyl-sn-glycerol-3-phosphate acyltransferase [Phenylobacterium sp.]MCA6271246.1 1-acyl-sn-glycerol-3-phosphate acyltransferase [Phenylobacterium sp.]
MSSNASAGSGQHIVDVLIAERAPRLAASPAWPLARPLLYRLLNYRRARRMADAIAPLPGIEALEHVSRLLEVKVKVSGLERIPSSGRLVIVSNHPTGIADGIAAWDTLRDRRPDLCFYANADAHRVVPGFSDVLIPVEWVAAKRTREHTRTTLHMTRQAMEAGRALAIFPAGRLARRTPDGRLCDPPWMSSAVSIARRHEAPVAPVHMTGPWSTLFHAFDRISKELRDITLFHELLNKRGGRFTLTVGPLVCPDRLGGDAEAATLALKTYVEQILPDDPDRPF